MTQRALANGFRSHLAASYSVIAPSVAGNSAGGLGHSRGFEQPLLSFQGEQRRGWAQWLSNSSLPRRRRLGVSNPVHISHDRLPAVSLKQDKVPGQRLELVPPAAPVLQPADINQSRFGYQRSLQPRYHVVLQGHETPGWPRAEDGYPQGGA